MFAKNAKTNAKKFSFPYFCVFNYIAKIHILFKEKTYFKKTYQQSYQQISVSQYSVPN